MDTQSVLHTLREVLTVRTTLMEQAENRQDFIQAKFYANQVQDIKDVIELLQNLDVFRRPSE